MSQTRRTPRLIFRPQPDSRSDEARLAAAREKAAEYLNPDPEELRDELEKREGTLEIEAWGDLAGQRIEEAMRRGEFDNLRGRGKPLQEDRNPFVPEDQQMAFKLLQNNDLMPDWIAERREVLRGIDQWRETFQRIVAEAQTAWAGAQTDERRFQIEQTWARWVERWEGEVVELNRRINTLNLKQPVLSLEIFKLRLDDEFRQAGAARKFPTPS